MTNPIIVKVSADGVVTESPATAQEMIELASSAPSLSESLKTNALEELNRVTGPSGTIIRCVTAGVAVPIEWTDYVFALRAIANGTDTTSTSLPAMPSYPAGT